MPHLDAISFFAVLLFLCAALLVGLHNRCFPRKLNYVDGLRFILVWMLFVIVCLIMNQIGRETLDPGRWPRERLFYGVEGSHVICSDHPAVDILFGWILFPLRIISEVRFHLPAIVMGMVATFLSMLGVHVFCRIALAGTWKAGWSVAVVLAFLTLFLTTYATVGLTRQLAWIVFRDIGVG